MTLLKDALQSVMEGVRKLAILAEKTPNPNVSRETLPSETLPDERDVRSLTPHQ